jgi:CheY-like chemotaxis protein
MKKILIVEDDLIIRSIYRRKFEMSGYKVETAEEGNAALKMLLSFKPDIVQMDIGLPGIDGVEVIRQMRASQDFRAIPILVLSSFYRPDLAAQAWKAGATKCVSKMDCTPNLALDLVEEILSGDTNFTPTYGTISLPKGALDIPSPSGGTISKVSGGKNSPPATGTPAAPKQSATAGPQIPKIDAPHLKVILEPAGQPAFFGRTPPPPFKPTTRPAFGAPPPPKPVVIAPTALSPKIDSKPTPEPLSGPDFRVEVRQEFLRRAPQIQNELRERVSSLIKSKSTTDQLSLLRELETCVSSLASLAGITGFSRISHLAGALDALIKDLLKKPNQMTASVLRTVAHASDCMNVLFRDLSVIPQDVPQSLLILAVDDEPISRRTIAVALGKARLRCVGLEDSLLALTILQENTFDLIFLDAEMPGLSGFELCAELRKLPTNKTTPVIFVTSLTKFEIRAQSSLSGGNDLIAKPFLMMELAVKALTYLLKPPAIGEGTVTPAAQTSG